MENLLTKIRGNPLLVEVAIAIALLLILVVFRFALIGAILGTLLVNFAKSLLSIIQSLTEHWNEEPTSSF
jgi:hypothetical protein